MANGDRPVHEIRYGAVKATVWKNPTKNGYMHNVVFSRIYKDGEQWKSSQSFSRSEMFDLGRCLLDAISILGGIQHAGIPARNRHLRATFAGHLLGWRNSAAVLC